MQYNKYGNKKITVDGMTFDSKREYSRYCELKLLEKAGELKNLQTQVKYILIPAQKHNGKVVEGECSYIADFVYQNKAGELIVEDTKGFKTKEYRIKRKLMLHIYGIRIVEI